jgi:phage shock protein A
MPQITPEKKSFWDRPEGTTGMIFAALAVVGLVLLAPTLVVLLQNTLYAILLGVAVVGIVTLALDDKFRNIVWSLYQIVCKKITGAIIELDPIAIVEGYIRTLEDNMRKMDEQIRNLRGQMASLKRVIEANETQRNSNLKTASAAKKAQNETAMVLASRKAGRLENSNLTLQALFTKLEVVYRVLLKMRENAAVVLEDTKDEVDVRKREFEAIKVSSNAFRSAMSVINGNPDKKAMFDQSMEFMANNIGERVGEMEHFMEISKGFMDSIDIQNGVLQEEGLKMLEEWEKKSTTFLLSPKEKQQVLAAANDEGSVVNLDEEDVVVGVGKSGGRSKYLS